MLTTKINNSKFILGINLRRRLSFCIVPTFSFTRKLKKLMEFHERRRLCLPDLDPKNSDDEENVDGRFVWVKVKLFVFYYF